MGQNFNAPGLQHPDAAFGSLQGRAWLAGEWVSTYGQSTWIAALRWERDAGTFTVRTLKSGREYGPHPITEQDAIILAQAESKGRVVNRLWGRTALGRGFRKQLGV